MNDPLPNPYQTPVVVAETMSAPPLSAISGKRLVIGMGGLAVLWWSLWAAAAWNPRWLLLALVASFVANWITDPNPWTSMPSDRSPKMVIAVVICGIVVIAMFGGGYIMLGNPKADRLPEFLKLPGIVGGLWLVSCLWITVKWWRRRNHPPSQPKA